jgi:hypothetical protein
VWLSGERRSSGSRVVGAEFLDDPEELVPHAPAVLSGRHRWHQIPSVLLIEKALAEPACGGAVASA